jgi:uracil-DNA glycosylase
MTNNFREDLNQWAEKTLRECTEIAINPAFEMNYLFYPLQSGVRFRPAILFIGANPGSVDGYREETVEKDILRTEQNEFLANYDTPAWRNLRSLTDTFSGEVLHPLFEEAVIINMFYFNSPTFNVVKKMKGHKEALSLCKQLTLEFIDIVQPQSIITLGGKSTNWMRPLSAERKMATIVSADNGYPLIGQATYRNIPLFSIHHPTTSRPKLRLYNTGENRKRKQEWFETYYRGLLSSTEK